MLVGVGEDIRRLRRIAGEMLSYRPNPALPGAPEALIYEPRGDFLAPPRLSTLPLPKASFLFDGMLISLDGDEAKEDEAPLARPADIAALLKPDAESIMEQVTAALKAQPAYPVPMPVRPVPMRVPDYGRIPSGFTVPPPDYPLAEGKGAMKALDGLVRWSNRDLVRDYEENLAVWEEARREFEEAVRDVQLAEQTLRDHLAAIDADQQSAFDGVLAEYERARSEWEQAAAEDTAYLQDVLEQLQLAYLDDPVELARQVLALTPLPEFLPAQMSGSFDATGVLVIDHDFPDDQRNSWVNTPSTGRGGHLDPRVLSEIFYPALALRCAFEIGRSANQNLVTDLVFNGWVTRIDAQSGRLTRDCVVSIAADLSRISALDFRSMNIMDTLLSLRGRVARPRSSERVEAHSAQELQQLHADEAAEIAFREQQVELERQLMHAAAEAERQRLREAAEAERRRQREAAEAAAEEQRQALLERQAREQMAREAEQQRREAARPVAPPPVPPESVALMDERRFDRLCRDLLAKEFGSENEEISITTSEDDHGFLAVIVDRHPLKGGRLVVQSRWSSEPMRVSALRELFGAIVSEGAVKGIHIAPGTYTREAMDFVSGKPITLIGGTELLGLLAVDSATGKASPQLRLVFNSEPPNSRSA